MNGWRTADHEYPSFANRLGSGGHPVPVDFTQSARTKRAGAEKVTRIGTHLHTLRRMDINELKISDAHTFPWAIDLLERFGPELDVGDTVIWAPPSSIFPGKILSENDTMACAQLSLLQPAIAAGVFIYANHYGLSSTEAGRYPKEGNWALEDRSIIGRDRRPDLVVARQISNVRTERNPAALVCEAKTYHVCHSNGTAISGVRHSSMPVLPELQRWFERDGDVPLIPAGNGEADTDAYYTESWQRKIQDFMVQVCLIDTFLHLLLISAVLGADGEVRRAARRTIQREGIYSHLPTQGRIRHIGRTRISRRVVRKQESKHVATIIFHRACAMHPL
jgi:hypothetical protein